MYDNHYSPSMDVQRDPSSIYRLKLRSGFGMAICILRKIVGFFV